MTTLVAMNTRDAIVMGCDSLGTITKRLVDPGALIKYFDPEDNYRTRIKADGNPELDSYKKIDSEAQLIPYDHMTHVDKLFPLYEPLKMAIMSSGISSIGDRTIKNLIGEFNLQDKTKQKSTSNYTLTSVGRRLLKFMWKYYFAEFSSVKIRPEIELMLGGYDKRKRTPGVLRIYVHENRIDKPDYDFAIYFGAQTNEIQRLIFGTDAPNKVNIIERYRERLGEYHKLLTAELRSQAIKIKLSSPNDYSEQLKFFKDWDLDGFDANIGAFSEQNAIECVEWLINIMIKSHQFSSHMPTVAGPVQVGVVKKDSGFTYVSKRVWQLGEHSIPMRE